MSLTIEQKLYIDPQEKKPVKFCPLCGAEQYARDGICLRCERRQL